MIVKIDPDDLGEEIARQLKGWADTGLRRAVNEGVRETAETAVKVLKQGGPYEERTGEYTKGWTYDIRATKAARVTGLDQYSVHNKKKYQLTHLLENGHQSRDGGRVRAFSHIGPANELVGQLAISNVGKRIRGMG